jgi:hypothetical protein
VSQLAESKETTYYKQRVLERDLKIDELGKLLENRNKQIKDLNEQIQRLKAEKFVNSTEEDIIKKILSYYAKGYQFSLILEKLRFNAYDVDIEKIKTICNNLDDLDNGFILYYKEQVEAYEKSIKINPELLKENSLKTYEKLINDAFEDLSKVETIEEKVKIRSEIKDLLDKRGNVFKNITNNTENVQNIKEVEAVMQDFNTAQKKLEDNLVVIDFSKVQVLQ